MLFNFCLLSGLSIIIIGVASANPVTESSQSANDIIDYSTDLVIEENPFPVLFRGIGALTGLQNFNIVNWLVTNFSYLVTAAVISFCRLSSLCTGLEHYLPITRHITSMVSQGWTPVTLETVEGVLITAMKSILMEDSEVPVNN